MKKSSALQRCAVHGNHAAATGTECETEVNYNKGRQAVVRMLCKFNPQLLMCFSLNLKICYLRTMNSKYS